MNPEISKEEDIFDIAISMQYFKHYNYSSDNIHTYANHFLFKSVYQKLLSFSKEELETVFWNPEKKEFHPNTKSKNNELQFVKNIFEINQTLKNSLFFAAFIEKKAFTELYHPFVQLLLKNKKTDHSLDFLDSLYSIQRSKDLSANSDLKEKTNLIEFSFNIFYFIKDLDTEEKNEVFLIYLNNLIQKTPEDFIIFTLNHLKSFNDEHSIIIKSKIKEYNLDINKYKVFEKMFPQEHEPSFFISSGSHEILDKAYDFGFRAKNYNYQNLDLPCSIFKYGLNGNTICDNWQTSFIKKLLQDSDLKSVDQFIETMGLDLLKLKKYGHHFENIGKMALNKKLEENLPELPHTKKSKI